MFLHYLAIGLGGALGAMTRVALSKLLIDNAWGVPFPILFINILGCFLMGLITAMMGSVWSASEHARYFWISGFLGGFTTFSAFALEVGLLFEKNQWLLAMTYIFLSVALSLIFFFIGLKFFRFLF
ncbi:fluoride efflux transporter FluC [Rickettsiella massiliensis]|uniref:fluoride efflux transporter FluC n=1 Tax=Rickettsiella massiliensis TaxID=676517 RepID=UPI00029A9E86|nr:CrcB family protein [Rickettsiella massiliensis]